MYCKLCDIHSGILELHIEDELRVEGALHSNGERGLDSLAGGGGGGAILIFVNHLDGEGTIEAKGGGWFLCLTVKFLNFSDAR